MYNTIKISKRKKYKKKKINIKNFVDIRIFIIALQK